MNPALLTPIPVRSRGTKSPDDAIERLRASGRVRATDGEYRTWDVLADEFLGVRLVFLNPVTDEKIGENCLSNWAEARDYFAVASVDSITLI